MTGKAGVHAQVPRKRYVFSLWTPQSGRTCPVSHRDSQPGMPQSRERVWMVARQKNLSCPLPAQHAGIKHHRVRLRGARTLGHASCHHRARCAGVTVVRGVRCASKVLPAEDGLWCPLRHRAREGWQV